MSYVKADVIRAVWEHYLKPIEIKVPEYFESLPAHLKDRVMTAVLYPPLLESFDLKAALKEVQ